MQRRRLTALIVQCERKKFIERIIGLVAEAGEELLASLMRTEKVCIKCEGRLNARSLREPLELRRGLGEAKIISRALAQFCMQRPTAPVGEVQQLLL